MVASQVDEEDRKEVKCEQINSPQSLGAKCQEKPLDRFSRDVQGRSDSVGPLQW